MGRANNNANANGGLVYANANNDSSNSNSNYGSRLTIKRKSLLTVTNRPYGRGHAMACAAGERHEPRQPPQEKAGT